MKRTRVAALLAVVALTFGACGSDDSGGAIDTGDPSTQQGGSSDDTVEGNTGPDDATNDTAAPVTAEGGDAQQSGGSAVIIKTFSFDPTPLRVKVGTTVTWTNQDQTLHTVTEGKRGDSDHDFDGELPDTGATFEHTFADAGTFDYHCTRHPGMDAQVVVE